MYKYTIARPWQAELVIEKSRFLCAVAKVASEEQAQEFIKKQKKQYWDATHNCSAYIIGQTSPAERSSDDGEPGGTAGVPMLTVLRNRNLFDVATVVNRYFGGIKLGAGGLIRAYTNSVTTALAGAGLAEVITMGRYVFTWEINEVGRVLNLLYRQQLFTVADVVYGQNAQVFIVMEASRRQEAAAWLTEHLSRTVELQEEKLWNEERAI